MFLAEVMDKVRPLSEMWTWTVIAAVISFVTGILGGRYAILSIGAFLIAAGYNFMTYDHGISAAIMTEDQGYAFEWMAAPMIVAAAGILGGFLGDFARKRNGQSSASAESEPSDLNP